VIATVFYCIFDANGIFTDKVAKELKFMQESAKKVYLQYVKDILTYFYFEPLSYYYLGM